MPCHCFEASRIMRTIVLVKQVPDPTVVKFNIETGCLDNVNYVIDPTDEVALSEAIAIRNKTAGHVVAITLGPPGTEDVLRTCLKMGADEAIHVCDEVFQDLDQCCVSRILAHAIARVPFDLILCSKESADRGNGFIGAAIAQYLGLPLVTAVTRIDIFADTNTAVVHRRVKGGDREIVESPLPALFAVETILSKPLYPPLRTILAGLNRHVTRLDAQSLGIDMTTIHPAMALVRVSQPKPRLKKTATIDSSLSPHERMKLIAAGGAQQKSSKLVEKIARAAAEDIVKFLIDKGIISTKE